ncbi:MAG: Gfo/Idh/MocA family oxidoreductase [Ferruginibacter sp.]|nr:Gfo/Idh/MocA family oxidoreductase [Ferruginibacter sp.]
MLKIGIIGAGHLGKFHLNNWMGMADVEIVGFCDTDEANAKSVIDKYKIKRFFNAEELLDNCDAIDIVAPTTYHYELCALALRKGKHVFVEKPLTNTMDEAKALLKLAKESNLKFQVGHVERFNPAFVALQAHKLEPMFIEVHRLAQFNPRGTDVSVILDLMIHDIDIILHLVKSNVSYISANGVSVLSETPDIANVRIEFDNGCVANLTSSRISMKKMRKMRIFQKDAYIGIDFLDKKTEVISQNIPTDKNVFTFDIDTGKGKKTVAIANPLVAESNAMMDELVAFKNAILNNTDTPVTIIDGYRAMEVAHQILDKINKTTK